MNNIECVLGVENMIDLRSMKNTIVLMFFSNLDLASFSDEECSSSLVVLIASYSINEMLDCVCRPVNRDTVCVWRLKFQLSMFDSCVRYSANSAKR